MPRKSWLWGLSDQSVQNFTFFRQLRLLSSGFINKLYPSYGRNMDKFGWHETFHLKNIQMKKRTFCFPRWLRMTPNSYSASEITFFLQPFLEFRVIYYNRLLFQLSSSTQCKILKSLHSIDLTYQEVKISQLLLAQPPLPSKS